MIPVTKTFLPPQEEYNKLLEIIWASNQIANGGELHSALTEKLKKGLKVSNVLLTTNGTLPLQIALKAVAHQGEVITTPFSYVATTSSIVWENCKPVFVDIHPNYLTINESLIEQAITEKTTAILATHVFGNPCNIEEIEKIATKHNLKVIYDAAHCFGVKYKEESIFNYGDISTCSFHATKIFHTGEGGSLFCRDAQLYSKLFYMHNFGHNGPIAFHGLGINAKMSELQAAMGLVVYPYVDEILEKRRAVVNFYDQNLNFKNLGKLQIRKNTNWNYSYYPVIFQTEEILKETLMVLNNNDIYPRRYFYPSLNTLKFTGQQQMPVSESISSRIACLPLYPDLKREAVLRITQLINSITN